MRVSVNVLIATFLLFLPAQVHGFGGGKAVRETPNVEYMSPSDSSVVDLTGKKELIFKWQMVPIPSGGRECYKFTLYEEDGYKQILSQTIDPGTFSAAIPSGTFEDDRTYRWSVKQRDEVTMVWSKYYVWYFKVVKK